MSGERFMDNLIPQKMLVGVDDSEGSSKAADYAIALAEKLGSSIVFIHIVTLGDTGRKILDAVESRARDRKITSKSLLEVGEPAKTMIESAQQENCDCIVVGKEGRPKVDGNLTPTTTAQKLITLSKVPVICV
jgi:nucleotide-binding universal stress UspA family protein